MTETSDLATSVAKNTAIQFGQQIVTWVSSFALMMFLPRYLGPVKYGRIYVAEMITAMFIVVVQYDGRYSIARRVSRDREHAGEIFVNSLSFRALLWLGSFAGMMTFAYFADYPMPVKIILILFGVEMIWITTRTVMSGVYLGFEITGYTALGAIAEKVFLSIAGITALLLGGTEITIAIVMIVASFLNFAVCAHFLKRLIPKLPRVHWEYARGLVREGFPFLLWTVFGIIYYRIDSVMLSLMTTEAVVGWYGAAYKFFDIMAFLPSIFSLAVLPVMSKLFGREGTMLSVTTQKSLNFILIVGIPLSVTVFFFSGEVINFFFGIRGYGPSVANLRFFAIGLPLLYIDMVLGTAIIACNKQKQLAWVALLGVFSNVGMNSLMIPYTQAHMGNGGIGAAIATIMTEFVVLISHLRILDRNLLEDRHSPVIIKSLLGGGVLIAALALTTGMHTGLYWMVHAGLGAIFYLGTLLAMRTFSMTELAFIRGFLSVTTIREMLASRGGTRR
jgi:O-antigen/teichoic acid export membrane protein